VLAEAAGRPELAGRRAQSPTEDGRMLFDSYSVVAEWRGELVKIAMMTVGKP
jgi:hypothetical protein